MIDLCLAPTLAINQSILEIHFYVHANYDFLSCDNFKWIIPPTYC